VGLIVQAGKSVKLRIGDRVIGAPWQTKNGQGSWQRYAVIKERDAVINLLQSPSFLFSLAEAESVLASQGFLGLQLKMPSDIPDQVAAQLWVSPFPNTRH
jgi:NADPH:quinone reductase-like Zn-dependent oxidoreductase